MHDLAPLPVDTAELLSYTSRELPAWSEHLALGAQHAEWEFGYAQVRRQAIAGLQEDLENFDETNHFQLVVRKQLPDDIRAWREGNRDPWRRFQITCREGMKWVRYLSETMDLRQAGAVLLLTVAIYHDGPAPHPALPEFLRAPSMVDPRHQFVDWAVFGTWREEIAKEDFLDRVRWAWARLRALPRSAVIVPAAPSPARREAPLPDTEQYALDVLLGLPPRKGLTAGQIATKILEERKHVVTPGSIYRALDKLRSRGFHISNDRARAGFYLSSPKDS